MLLHVSFTSNHHQVDISVHGHDVQCLEYGSAVCHKQHSCDNTRWYMFVSTLQNLIPHYKNN